VSPVAGEVLRLQRSGGNHAVDSMLAQRQPDKGGDEPVTRTIILDEPVGVLPVLSVSYGADPAKEVNVLVPSTGEDSKLLEWAAKGHHFEKVTISSGSGLTITIADALLTSVRPQDQTSLSFSGTVEVKAP
jgi:hypothetical protein